ncbi:MAG TPA: ATP-binding protein [Anaerolineales bacterium]|jgi:PAS domain S-box-containing protein|nr:ATP-binding protein [Anaerolineales bacterium]
MNLPSRIPRFAFLNRRQPNLEEIEALLDLYPIASLLVDLQRDRILLANAKATELTAFTRMELTDMPLGTLFPNLSPGDCIPSDFNTGKKTFTLTTPCLAHSGTQIEVILTSNRLATAGSWALLTVQPLAIHEHEQSERQRLTQRLKDFHALANTFLKADIDQALKAAVEIGHNLTGAAHLGVYVYDSPGPQLMRRVVWGDQENLPAEISPADAGTLTRSTLWAPGKRTHTALHRHARASGYTYLASVPLGEAGAFVGLVVAADPLATPPSDLLPTLGILAANLTAAIQHYAQTTHLLEDRKERQRSMKIGEIVRENIQESVILLDPDLRVLDMNPAAELTLGFACNEICSGPVENVLIGAENLIPALQTAQQGIPTHNLGNVRFHRRSGEPFSAHVRIFPFTGEEHLEGIVVLIQDLSEHEQVRIRNQQLEQRALLGEVTAIFAHEVRNPINSLSTGLQLLEMNLSEDDPNQEIITRLGSDLNRLDHLMDSVLTVSRPVQNKMEPVALDLLLQRLLERWRPRLARESIQHHLQLSTEQANILGDARTLEQVFNNLISNAVDAMGERGDTLTLHIRRILDSTDREQIEVSVSDNGPGIPQENRERIFDPFFSTSKNGTGLGLAIAKRIVTAHKGTIHVTSVPGGTVFQVVFPAAVGG